MAPWRTTVPVALILLAIPLLLLDARLLRDVGKHIAGRGTLESTFDYNPKNGRKHLNDAVSPSNVYLITLFSVVHAERYIDPFLRHYIGLGVPAENMLIMLNYHEEDDAALSRFEGQFRAFGVANFLWWVGPYNSCERLKREVLWLHALNVTSSSQWIIPMDADEFLQLPSKYETIEAFATHLYRGDYTAASAIMLDRVSLTGELVPIRPNETLDSQFPYGCHITRRVAAAYDWKAVLHRADFRATSGHHNVATHPMYFNINQNTRRGYCAGIPNWKLVPHPETVYREYGRKLVLHHFKWDANTLAKLAKRIIDVEAAGATHATESIRLRQYIAAHGGTLCVECKRSKCALVGGGSIRV